MPDQLTGEITKRADTSTLFPSPVAGPDLGNPSLYPPLVAVREDTAVNPEGEDLRPRSMCQTDVREVHPI